MMRESWEAPKIAVQQFVSGEFAVNPCYTLYCEVAGNEGRYNQDTWFDKEKTSSIFEQELVLGDDNNYYWGDLKVTPDKQLHGRPCAEACSYDSENKIFYENGKRSEIGGVQISEKHHNTLTNWFFAVWGSIDINQTGNYTHYGWAVFDENYSTNHS